MKARLWTGVLFLEAVLTFSSPAAESGPLLRFEGAYLAYSYDHNLIFGETITFRLDPYDIACRYLKIDIASRSFAAYGEIVLSKDGEKLKADEFLFDPQKKAGLLITYGDTLDIRTLDPRQSMSPEAKQDLIGRRQALAEVSLKKIQDSLIYAAARALEISPALEISGTDVVLFVEGIASIGFKTFKLSGGNRPRTNGLSLDKVWFTKSQGLFGKASYSYERENKIQSFTQIYYEEHSILKNYVGLPRQLDLQTSTTWTVKKNLSLGLAGNYNSTSLWNTRLWLDTRSRNDKNSLLLDFSYNKPLQARGETWLGLQSRLNFDKWGQLSLQGKYEVHDQALVNITYNNVLLRKVNLQLLSNYSRILVGGTGQVSEIFTGNANLAYNADRFNLVADYYLNADLFGNQRLTRPQMRFGLNPLTFYGGFLTATLQNIFVINNMSHDALTAKSFSNNTTLNLSVKPMNFGTATNLQIHFALEQFLEKEGRNFTSGGMILRANRTLGSGIRVEGFYSLQSRRRSKGWLIEGTMSQDVSAVVRADPGGRISGWVSFSYDPKAGEWKQSFADISIGLFKNWKFQSLLNYDFYRNRLNNIDLYLVRDAGRFDLRFIWRSISKQFLIELIPSI